MEFNNQQTHLQDLEIANEAKTPEQVNVFVNGQLLTINSLDPIYEIENVIGIRNMRFVSNGRVLLPALSFKFNGIKDGSTIIALPPKNDIPKLTHTTSFQRIKYNETKRFTISKIKERFEKNWAEKYRDPDSIFEQLRDTTDPRTADESARISDLFRMRIENNHIAFRKVCNKFNLKDDDLFFAPNEETLNTVIPSKSFSPSTKLLPELSLH
ncbi:hypothetical protein M9Y10_025935 [Tritrichomonas musculus]|uniref:Uncharacterized protein n=1 Tax=Tritrichomonas musculus TaxID=1915356 RepID=A0ABR2H8V3_9EUKA